MNHFDEMTRITKLHAYAVTGNKSYLKDMPMGFNEPTHLPQPKGGPYLDPVKFDVYDVKFMQDLTDDYIGAPLSALLQTLDTMGDVRASVMLSRLKNELSELRAGLTQKFREDF